MSEQSERTRIASNLSRRDVAAAGHDGDVATAHQALASGEAALRVLGLGALERLGVLTDAELAAALADPGRSVRHRAATIAARHPEVDLLPALADGDPGVVEVAAWACGERETASDAVLVRLVELAGSASDALVRESAVAALGAIGDDRGLDAILAATSDKPAIRRRAVLALAPFLDRDHSRAADVASALDRALTDRDWQVRQAAEDLLPDE